MSRRVNPRVRRNCAFQTAKEYARTGNFPMAEAWIRRAEEYHPLSVMQIWSFKKLLGSEKFASIAPARCRDLDISRAALGVEGERR